MKDSTDKPIRLLITGGGTGGHLFPAVAAAQALRLRQPESEVLFIGTRRKIDTTTLDSYGFASCSIHSYGVKGKSLPDLLKALLALPVSIFQAIAHIRRFRPDVALGVGGYVTGPVMVAARLMGVPTIIHEQNSVPGLANRKLGALVNRICVSLPGSERFFPADKTVMTGNPVRQNILALAREQKVREGKFTIMILGGSQGAHAVNRLVLEALCDHGIEYLHEFAVIHQTGQKDADWVEKRYRQAGVEATVAPFFRDMAEVYGKADLLVSRAGATTLTELAVLGKPAILIPYPFAADDHQTKNGAYYVDGGGAVQFLEKDLSGELLFHTIDDLRRNSDRRSVMADGMRRLAIPDAAEQIVDVCLLAAGRSTAAARDIQPGN